ncbi:MAG: epoxide hydrolase 1 [Pseudomonadales bacterium]|nr:epoxide hydrolase 1 [Pseudomonadales bacterium]
MSAITPFKIDIDEQQIVDLKQRLEMTRWPEKETPTDWTQGIPLSYVQEIVEYWKNSYNWREREALLNRFDQFKTEINGLNIHFIHQRSKVADATPLIITHGWPGSIVEFQKVIEPLTDPEAFGGKAEDAYHVICPSIPGYAFSDKPAETGWDVTKVADTWAKLMAKLGYDKYFAQGGDWGSMITTALGIQDPEHCMGIHLNMPIAGPDPETMNDLTDREKMALAAMQHYQDSDSGYSKQQSTRPQTLGYGLVDSPAGQAAWIIEKFYAWMDCDGHPENVVTKDELLDNVMMYWLPATGASSARLYWESFGGDNSGEVTIATGASGFPKEIFPSSERWLAKRFTNLVYYNELNAGGHFAAFEVPEVFVKEVTACFSKMR